MLEGWYCFYSRQTKWFTVVIHRLVSNSIALNVPHLDFPDSGKWFGLHMFLVFDLSWNCHQEKQLSTTCHAIFYNGYLFTWKWMENYCFTSKRTVDTDWTIHCCLYWRLQFDNLELWQVHKFAPFLTFSSHSLISCSTLIIFEKLRFKFPKHF